MPKDLWNAVEAAGDDNLDSLVYRSQLLGTDRAIVNIYGGNTSAKLESTDHLGRGVEVLWVKGSGSDLATIGSSGFAALRLDEILPLFERSQMSDEEMTWYLERCIFEPGRPRQSIETLLHVFIPAKHVDHTHPDAVISLASSPRGRQVVHEIYGKRAAWAEYVRPGFALSKEIGRLVRNDPDVECVVMAKHGLVTWGDTSEEAYHNTVRIIDEAERYLAAVPDKVIFGPVTVRAPEPKDRNRILTGILPILRGAMSTEKSVVLNVDLGSEILNFVNGSRAPGLSQIGAACPDHLVHTKRLPLFITWNPSDGADSLKRQVLEQVDEYTDAYRDYFNIHHSEGDHMSQPTPRVILIPGLGMITAGPHAFAAEVSRQLYRRAIEAMRGAVKLGGFSSLTPQESFAVEYWPLELYKLSLRPPQKILDGKVALITGGASGIGRATAYLLAFHGAHVAVADIDLVGAKVVAEDIVQRYGFGRAIAIGFDVADENQVMEGFAKCILTYGGLDIVINNAGISSSAPIEHTTLEMWDTTFDVLAKGYFLVAREAFRIWKEQATGGNLIVIASKNSVAAGRSAAAYSAAKAAELHLARCLAEEGGSQGIRVNSILPDAVLRGSKIWSSSWRGGRAKAYGIPPEQLEEHYRQRTTLQVNVYPEDVAEAALFFASPASSKTTGGLLTVDGGISAAYAR